METNTIVAVATSLATTAAINIIKISGKDAFALVQSVFSCAKLPAQPVPNYMYLGRIVGENFSERAFCVFFKAPHSYTGEDVAEIHCHGGIAVTQAIVRLLREKGARPAQAGEFTKRAFLNGKLTLAEAEGLLDVINAESESAIHNAYRLVGGKLLQGLYESEKRLINAMAMLEVKLDYPEEVEEDTFPQAKEALLFAKNEADKLLASTAYVKTVRLGADIAIVGLPNVGKSTLLNALVRSDRAIVSDIAGTTRDVLCESIELGGIRLNFLDTAGIREGGDVIEKIGVERSKKAIEGADLVLFVVDLSRQETADEKEIAALIGDKKYILVGNKADLKTCPRDGAYEICARTGEGMDKLTDKILSLLDRDAVYSQGILTNERHISALSECDKHLTSALSGFDVLPVECTLSDIRSALDALGQITGTNVSDAVIDNVFANFCVGK